MTTQRPFTRKEFGLAIACALALGVFSESANSQARDINSEHAPVAQYVAPVAAPAPAPAPEPVAAAAAPLPVYEKVAFEANVLFDSDKSALRPAGRDTLDEFVARIHVRG